MMEQKTRIGIRSTRVLVPDQHGASNLLNLTLVIDSKSGLITGYKPSDVDLYDTVVYDVGDAVVMPGVVDVSASLDWDLGLNVPCLFDSLIY